MKKIFLFAFLLLLNYSCKKHERNAQLIKECGIFMLIEGEYFRICNKSDFTNIPSGTILNIKYKIVKSYNCEEEISCACCILPFVPNENIIEVKVVD